MSKRVSQTILLCEDAEQERLAKAYLKICGKPTLAPYVKSLVASRLQYGGGVDWVLNEFPKQLHACRQRQKKAQTQLVVLIDADNLEVDERRRQLFDRVKQAGYEPFGKNEPAIVLVPKRHVETWICALLGISVTENEDYKRRKRPKKEELHRAAQTLFDWSRPNATPGATCIPSLELALPEWRKIG